MESLTFVESLNSFAAEFIAELYNIRDLPRIRVHELIVSFEKLIQQSFVRNFIDRIIDRLGHLGESQNNLADFKAIALLMRHPFEKFKTEALCLKYFEDIKTYIPPEEIEVIDEDEHVPANPIQLSPKPVVKIQFIPLRRVLQKFFEIPGIFENVASYVSEIRKYKSFSFSLIQSEYWKSIEALCNEEFVLPLFFYQDDVETNNPLGSHKGVGKIGAVYVVIPCLPPNLQSKTEYVLSHTIQIIRCQCCVFEINFEKSCRGSKLSRNRWNHNFYFFRRA